MFRLVVGVALMMEAAAPAGSAQSASVQQSAAAATSSGQPAAAAQTKTLNLTAYAELLRADVMLEKAAIITEVMGFTEEEDKVFWPIYREYDAEMAKLGDERVALLAEYARTFEHLTDDAADGLARKAIDLDSRRQAVKAKYYERMRTALKGRTALRYLQVEHQLQLLIDLQISAALPIAGR
jgi:hypothetical protein